MTQVFLTDVEMCMKLRNESSFNEVLLYVIF